MRGYSNKTIMAMLVIAIVIILFSMGLVYTMASRNIIDIADDVYDAKIENASNKVTVFFDEGVFLVDLLCQYTTNIFEPSEYEEDTYHIESIKEKLTPLMEEMVEGKNLNSAYIYFNPTLTGRPNDIWLKDEDGDGQFNRVSEVPSSYFDYCTEDKAWYFECIDAGEGVWVKPHYNKVFNYKELMFSYNQPVYKDNILVAVVGVEFSEKNIERVLWTVEEECQCHFWVADSDDRFVFHPLGLGYKRIEDYFGYIDTDKLTVDYTDTYEGKAGETIKVMRLSNEWLVGATFYNKSLNDKLFEIIRMVVAMVFFGLLALTSGAYIISKRISDPLKRLTEEIEEIELGTHEGNISQELLSNQSDVGHLAISIFKMVEAKKNSFKEIGKQRDEIIHLYEETYAINADLESTLFQKEQLYDDLNIMFKKLEDANKDLESRVEERTLELNEKNNALERALKENKKNNSNLRKLNKDLEKSLNDLTLAQERLIESEKMVALGNMVSGIAHEINTPLGVSLTAISYIMDQFSEFENDLLSLSDEELIELLTDVVESSEIVYEALNRSIELVSSFKEIAVNQHSNEKLAFNLLDYTHTVTRSMKHEFKQVVETLDIDIPETIDVYSYPGAYSQIITNLVMNSIKHGFEGRSDGVITIKAREEEEIITILYRDNGKGIKENHLKKIFEPFFTTMRAKGGTGLGLSVVYNLVNASLAGKIECSSEPGEGTQFKITIPANIDKAEIQE